MASLLTGPLREDGKEAGDVLGEYIDGHLLSQVTNGFDTFDDGDIGGTDGNPIELSANTPVAAGNTAKVMTYLFAKLRDNKVKGSIFHPISQQPKRLYHRLFLKCLTKQGVIDTIF